MLVGDGEMRFSMFRLGRCSKQGYQGTKFRRNTPGKVKCRIAWIGGRGWRPRVALAML